MSGQAGISWGAHPLVWHVGPPARSADVTPRRPNNHVSRCRISRRGVRKGFPVSVATWTSENTSAAALRRASRSVVLFNPKVPGSRPGRPTRPATPSRRLASCRRVGNSSRRLGGATGGDERTQRCTTPRNILSLIGSATSRGALRSCVRADGYLRPSANHHKGRPSLSVFTVLGEDHLESSRSVRDWRPAGPRARRFSAKCTTPPRVTVRSDNSWRRSPRLGTHTSQPSAKESTPTRRRPGGPDTPSAQVHRDCRRPMNKITHWN